MRFRKIFLETITGWVGWEDDWNQKGIVIYLVSYEPMQQRQYKLRRSGDYGRCQDMELTNLEHLLVRERGNEGFCQVSDLGDITL